MSKAFVIAAICCGCVFFSILLIAVLFGYSAVSYNPKYKIEAINERSELGEGPYWDDYQQMLYWVDMRNNALLSYNPATNAIRKAIVDSHVEGRNTDFTPVTVAVRVMNTENKFVIGLKGSLAVVEWDGQQNINVTPNIFLDIENPNGSTRLNDGKADPKNRLWIGSLGAQLTSNPNTFEKNKGSLYMVEHDGKLFKKLSDLQIANGLEWSLDGTKFYFIDSLTYTVYEFDYNNEDGTITNQRDLYNLKEAGLVNAINSLPDGMTIDNEGHLWVAVYGTGKVIRINPKTGNKVFELTLPGVLQPTSVCFGGRNLDTLFVTSAHVDWNDELEKEYPKSGYTFQVTGLRVYGFPSRPMKLDSTFLKNPPQETN